MALWYALMSISAEDLLNVFLLGDGDPAGIAIACDMHAKDPGDVS
jgi:hypothetical protein